MNVREAHGWLRFLHGHGVVDYLRLGWLVRVVHGTQRVFNTDAVGDYAEYLRDAYPDLWAAYKTMQRLKGE